MGNLPSDLNLTLNYRPIVYRIYYLILAGCILTLLIIGRIHYFELIEKEWYIAITKWALASSVPITILIRTVLFFRPRIYCEYQVDGSKLIITRKKKIKEVFFEQIDRIDLSKLSPRFLGGFTIRLKSGACFRILPLLENSHLLLQRILDDRPTLVTGQELEKFTMQARLVDHSWARIREKMMNWKVAVAKYLALPAGLTQIGVLRGWRWPGDATTTNQYLGLFLIIFAAVLLIGFAMNHVEERIIQHHQVKTIKDGVLARDMEFERKVAWTAHTVGVTLLLSGFFLLAI